jgi:hypothetical protein
MKTKIKNLYTNEIEELLCLVGRIDREIMNFSHVSEHLPNSIKRELDVFARKLNDELDRRYDYK